MRTALKHIVAHTYKPFLVKYLSKTRFYQNENIRLEVPPQVFHPGFFYSTPFLHRYLSKLAVAGKKFLELGAGSGFIALSAAKKGAIVTASDINPVAIEYLQKNSTFNQLPIEIILSDLFENIPAATFDIIAINPPYYKKKPRSLLDHAWFCGEQGEYFSRLFNQLPGFIHTNSEVLMVLCEGCDVDMIRSFASIEGFRLRLMQVKQNILEKDFIYRIEKIV